LWDVASDYRSLNILWTILACRWAYRKGTWALAGRKWNAWAFADSYALAAWGAVKIAGVWGLLSRVRVSSPAHFL
jgi:hypothetical protein